MSIIIPSFNQGRFIEEAITSILAQEGLDIELIVMDGGSTDRTVEILKRYSDRLAYWVSEPDRGQAHAVNKGLALCTGDIVGWLNSDDVYCPGAFARVARAFHENPDAIVVHGDRIMLDEKSHVSGWSVLPAFDPETTGFIVCSETAFWRRSKTVGERLREDMQFAMDLEFFSRLYQLGPFVKLNAFLGYFRCYGDNKSSTIPEVGQRETKREWTRLFGDGHAGWQKRPVVSKWKLFAALVRHPRLVAWPYLYRRFILGRRGL